MSNIGAGIKDSRRRFNCLEAQGNRGRIALHGEEHFAAGDHTFFMLRPLFEAQTRAIKVDGL